MNLKSVIIFSQHKEPFMAFRIADAFTNSPTKFAGDEQKAVKTTGQMKT